MPLVGTKDYTLDSSGTLVQVCIGNLLHSIFSAAIFLHQICAGDSITIFHPFLFLLRYPVRTYAYTCLILEIFTNRAVTRWFVQFVIMIILLKNSGGL